MQPTITPKLIRKQRILFVVSVSLFSAAVLFSQPSTGPDAGAPNLVTQIVDPEAAIIQKINQASRQNIKYQADHNVEIDQKQVAGPEGDHTSGEVATMVREQQRVSVPAH